MSWISKSALYRENESQSRPRTASSQRGASSSWSTQRHSLTQPSTQRMSFIESQQQSLSRGFSLRAPDTHIPALPYLPPPPANQQKAPPPPAQPPTSSKPSEAILLSVVLEMQKDVAKFRETSQIDLVEHKSTSARGFEAIHQKMDAFAERLSIVEETCRMLQKEAANKPSLRPICLNPKSLKVGHLQTVPSPNNLQVKAARMAGGGACVKKTAMGAAISSKPILFVNATTCDDNSSDIGDDLFGAAHL